MARVKKLEQALPEITRKIDSENCSIFRPTEWRNLYQQIKDLFDLPERDSLKSTTKYLAQYSKLKPVTITFPWRSFTRYIWGIATPYDIAQSFDDNGYFSHFTAAKLHGITQQIPKDIYFNVEQTPKPPPNPASLTQDTINRAFQRNHRKTNQIAIFEENRFLYLMGKNTSNLGVNLVSQSGESSHKIRVTDLERTLIDITVRPEYSGGIHEVLAIYKAVKNQHLEFSDNRLRAYIKQLNYIYPYQQSIGFLLERARFKSIVIDALRNEISSFDFYLGYGHQNLDYSNEWKLFFPKGL